VTGRLPATPHPHDRRDLALGAAASGVLAAVLFLLHIENDWWRFLVRAVACPAAFVGVYLLLRRTRTRPSRRQ
jgi:hypothetical protein